MARLRKPAVLAACLLLLAASCTALSHRESIERLQEGHQAKVEAERRTLAIASGSGGVAVGNLEEPPGPEPLMTLQDARRALARDAERDLEMARTTFARASDEDRISALYRAALKAWHAGPEADPDLVTTARKHGSALCRDLGARMPQRDCAMISIAPYLGAMEASAAEIFRVDTEKLRARPEPLDASHAATLVAAVRDLDQAMKLMDSQAAELPAVVRRFADEQKIYYYCWSVVAMIDLVQLGPPDSAERKLANEAEDLLKSDREEDPGIPSDALVDLLAENGVTGTDYVGAYRGLVGRINALLEGDRIAPSSVATAKETCRMLDRT